MNKAAIALRRLAIVLLVGWFSLLVAGPVLAADPVEGKDYVLLDPPQPTSTGDKIEVVEVFWYGCPHCYHLEPYVNRWLKTKPDNVAFVRIPGVLSPRWMLHGQAYYTAEVLGVVDKVHDHIFDAIHGKRQRLDNEQDIMALFKEYGVPEEDFKKAFDSFAVQTKMRRAAEMNMRYDIDGVPTLIVNGKYRTSPSMVGSNAGVFKVVNYLVAKESKK